MASSKPCFTFKTDKDILNKLAAIAEKEHRTANKQLEYILLSYFETYEKVHGEIKIESE